MNQVQTRNKVSYLDKNTRYNEITQEFYDGTHDAGFSIWIFIKLTLDKKLGGSEKKKTELYFKKLIKDHLIYALNVAEHKNNIDPHNMIYFWTNLADFCFGSVI